MDRKAVIVLGICFVLLLLWGPLVNRLYPPAPRSLQTNQVSRATNEVSPRERSRETNSGSGEEIVPIEPADTEEEPEAPEQTMAWETEEVRYVFSSSDGGIKRIELKEFPTTTSCEERGNGEEPHEEPVVLHHGALPSILSFLAPGGLQERGGYELVRTKNGIRAEKILENGLAVVKEFTIGEDYAFTGVIRLENRGDRALSVPSQRVMVGTATPIGEESRLSWNEFYWYNGAKTKELKESWFDNRTLGCIPGTPREVYTGGEGNVHWVAVNNQFFTIAGMTATNNVAEQVIVRRMRLSQPSAERGGGASRDALQAALVFPEELLEAGGSMERRLDFYAGPKEYNRLAKIGHARENELDALMGLDGFFGFFSKALLLSMNLLHRWGLDYGWAIVAITVVIKTLFWPLTRASTRSMKRMSALQPQMKALQEKYKDDPQKMNRKMMEFMKENRVNPLGGCLPMLLQIPVFMGFFFMIRSAIELRGASFLWACDLSQSDTVATVLGFPINIFPLIMGGTQLWQMSLTPPSPGMDPMQQKIMKYMPLMFVIFLYSFPAGLTLYWTVQNLLSVLQTKLTKNEPLPAAAQQPTPTGPSKGQLPPIKKKKKKQG